MMEEKQQRRDLKQKVLQTLNSETLLLIDTSAAEHDVCLISWLCKRKILTRNKGIKYTRVK